jgi:hypothetical protein
MKTRFSRLCAPAIATNRPGASFTRVSAKARLKDLASSHVCPGRTGTTMWTPLPPEVRANPRSFTCASASRTIVADSTICFQDTPAPGSRSNTSRSGVSGAAAVAPQGCNSSAFICTRPRRPSSLRITRCRSVLPSSSISTPSMAAGMPLAGCFWKNALPPSPSGHRRIASGRFATCGSIRDATAS